MSLLLCSIPVGIPQLPLCLGVADSKQILWQLLDYLTWIIIF